MNRIRGSLILVLLAPAACSLSELTGTDDDTFTQGEADAFVGQIGEAFAHGMNAASPVGGSPPGSPPVLPAGASAYAGIPVNIQIQHRTNCTAGGNIQVSGNMTGSVDDTGSGALFLQVLETISDWRCIGDRVVNGDPYLSAAGTFTFLNGQQSGTASISFGGGVKWGGTAAESCQMTLTMLFHPDHTGRLSGVVCGRSVSVAF